ncbi:MAG: hypothetical protein JNK35_11600 [Phycisphaerae bacterium]|nr:hypothetical protein [Phycisphaerae bacterium]
MRRRTSAKQEADRQRAAHGEALLGPDGRVIPAAVFRAARGPAAPTRNAAPAGESPDPTQSTEPADAPDLDDEDLLPPPAAGDASAGESAPIDPGAPPPRVVFTLQRDLAKRLDKYLADRITFMSRSKLQELVEAGGVTVNGRTAKSSTVLRAGDVVEVAVPPPPSEDFPEEDIPLDVLFEDEHLIVLNKSPDIIVHPARTHKKGTLINALAFHFRHRSTLGGDLSGVGRQFARPGVVHRLDRATSGCIVFAKTEQAHWQLANQFMARTVDKRYVALAHGHVEPVIDVIDLPLGPHPSRERGYREKQVVRHDALGKPAVTIYRVLATLGTPAGGSVRPPADVPRVPPHKRAAVGSADTPRPAATPSDQPGPLSLIEVELKTGRTHQIRVHLSHRGFPLAGDDMYGGRPVSLGSASITRQALHAAVLAFRHPISGTPMRFVAPLPADLRNFIAAGRRAPDADAFALAVLPSPPGSVLTLEQLLGEPRAIHPALSPDPEKPA